MRLATGSQCKFFNTGVIRSNFRVPDTILDGLQSLNTLSTDEQQAVAVI